MAKLTKKQSKLHLEAMALLQKDTLSYDEKWFVLENLHEGALTDQTYAGAWFTPSHYARDFAIDIFYGKTIVDICAGIGSLAFMALHMQRYNEQPPEITCIEINPAFVEIGKKLLPEATWICGDIFEIWRELPNFDCAISNPPFGNNKLAGKSPVYRGSNAEYKVIDIASKIAKSGTFIVPQMSAPFKYSGERYYQERATSAHTAFKQQTGIELCVGVGIDTQFHAEDWKVKAPLTEVVCVEEFPVQSTPSVQAYNLTKQLDLFNTAA